MRHNTSDYVEWRDRLKLQPTPEQDIACKYLDLEGLRFLVDFGTDNAPAIAAYRIAESSGVTWNEYFYCAEHGAYFQPSCLCCDVCKHRNQAEWLRLAEWNGWLPSEPSGDVPLVAPLNTREPLTA